MSNVIRLTGFKLFGHALFEDGTTFTLHTDGLPGREYQSRTVQFNTRLRLNRVVGLVGINATGKSTLLELFQGLNDFYLGQKPINQTVLQRALWTQEDEVAVTAYLATDDDQRYVVKTRFVQQSGRGALDLQETTEWVVDSEEVYAKSSADDSAAKLVGSSQNRHVARMKQLVDRTQLSTDGQRLLGTRDSVFRVIVPEAQPVPLVLVGETTTTHVKIFGDQVPTELLAYIDPSIASLSFIRDDAGRVLHDVLVYKTGQQVVVNQFSELVHYLSDGTMRSLVLFYACMDVLKSGATLLVDDIERQLDQQLVRDLVDLFSDSTMNVNAASLGFTTHDMPLLDDLKRDDELYVLTRDEQVRVLQLSDDHQRGGSRTGQTPRQQVKGTAPNFMAYLDLKALIEKLNKRGNK